MPHTALHNKADFEKAVATKDKNVLIYIYEGSFNSEIDAHADKHSATTDAYKADATEHPAVKDFFKITQTPTVIVFKNGSEVKRVVGENPAELKDLVALLSS